MSGQCDLKFAINEFDDAMTGTLSYWDRTITPESMERVGHLVKHCLSLVLADPSITISQVAAETKGWDVAK
jgi:hypothetical protein